MAAPTALTVVKSSETPAALSLESADTANGNSFANTNGDVLAIIKNEHETNAETFIFAVQNATKTVEGWGPLTKASISVSVSAGAQKVVGPFPTQAFNDANGLVQVTYTGTGTPKISAVRSDNLKAV